MTNVTEVYMEVTMTRNGKEQYCAAILKRYHRSGKVEKGRILDEFCEVCGFNRSYAIRLLNQGYKRRRSKPGRRSKYADDAEFMKALRIIWKASNFKCGRLLKQAIGYYLPSYPKHHGELSTETKEKLLQVSASTIDRVLKRIKAQYSKGRSTTKPGSLIRSEIPISTQCWDTFIPGFMEADTVAHCGISAKGPFALTLTMTDIATAWTENRAVWTKKADGVVEQVEDIQKSLPFDLLGFDCDNGSEFLNDHLVRYFQGKKIPMTRSRPYKKNDNAHVEQKNWMTARQLFGYIRIENPDCVPLMNDIYANEWCWYQNFFTPTLKLKDKYRDKSKWKRVYEKPKTPFERVWESEHISQERKDYLLSIFKSLDPFELKKQIDKKSRIVHKLSSVNYETWKQNNIS